MTTLQFPEDMSPEDRAKFLKFYILTDADKRKIIHMKTVCGQTIEEIARRMGITPPDVNRILHPIPDYKKYTAQEKMEHWRRGKVRAQTVKRKRDELQNNKGRKAA